MLLTPGPYAETYFEHAYLARQLGFPLVEGSDLTVRHDRVFLKTVSGLRPVHAILRRLDDDYCDPVELRSDSTLGVPGLVQAWRAGNVLVANAFGLGVLESPALLGFLPKICQRLLGEPLETPALATWWCGEAAALADARRRLDVGVIKPAFARAAMQPVFTSELDVVGPAGVGAAARQLAGRLRGRGVPAALVRAGLAQRPDREPGTHAARLPHHRRSGRLPCAARRAVAHRRQRPRHRVERPRRQQQGHVGGGRCCTRPHAVDCRPCPHARVAWRTCHVEPRGGEPVLAGTLRGAERELRPIAAVHAEPAGRRPLALGHAASGIRAHLRAARPVATERGRSRGRRSVRRQAGPCAARGDLRSRRSPWSRFQRRADRPRRRRRARPSVDRQLARPEPADAAVYHLARRRPPRSGARGDRRCAAVAGGGGRPRDGAHDPRPGLALPQPGPASRTGAVHCHHGARRRAVHRRGRTRRCSSGCSNCRTVCSPTASATCSGRSGTR